jgi:hypothetical protein
MANENFSELTDRVNQAQAKVNAAETKNRAELQAQVEHRKAAPSKKPVRSR